MTSISMVRIHENYNVLVDSIIDVIPNVPRKKAEILASNIDKFVTSIEEEANDSIMSKIDERIERELDKNGLATKGNIDQVSDKIDSVKTELKLDLSKIFKY